jgi:ATP-binding cassette subfamily F protein 3
MLAQIQGLGRRIGDRWLFRDASLSVRAGDRIGIVGPNGAGKSTLLRVVAGDEPPDEGTVSTPRDTRIGMLRQEIDPRLEHSVHDEAARALARLDRLEEEMRALEAEMTECGHRGEPVPASTAERYDRITAEFTHAGGYDRDARVARVLAGLGFDEAARARPLRTFSGGWLMRVELAKLFLATPDLLLLDEPTNHLDLPAIQWFEEAIADFPGALLIVSHDRTFLRRHVGRVVDFDGRGRVTVYEGGYDRFLAQREERRAQLLAEKANQDRQIAQMERFVERFRAKSTKARQAQSRIKALGKIERIEVDAGPGRAMRVRIPPPPRAGEQVLTLRDVHKAYGETVVYRGVDVAIRRGERVALAGPNGAGKSTLLRIVAGVLPIDAGERRPGHNVQVAFFAQHQLEALVESRTVLEEIAADAHTEDVPRLRAQLGAFLFSGDDVEKKIGVLSGGEKSRVALAKLLLRPANLLVLDEPTNHLDIASCEALERALDSYEGTLVFVSHDRAFINALATRVIEVDHGHLRDFPGDYDDYRRAVARLDAKAAAAETSAATAPSAAPTERAPERPAHRKEASRPPPATKAERQAERERRKTRDKIARRITRLEEEIHAHEEALTRLDWRLGDPSVYADAEQVAGIQAEQSQTREKVDALYAEWERHSDELAALDDLLAD